MGAPIDQGLATPVNGTAQNDAQSVRGALPPPGDLSEMPDALPPADSAGDAIVENEKLRGAGLRSSDPLQGLVEGQERADALGELQRSLTNEALDGLQQQDDQPVQSVGGAASSGAAAARQDSMVDYKALKELIQVDAVNGLGQAVGLKNHFAKGVRDAQKIVTEYAPPNSDPQGSLDAPPPYSDQAASARQEEEDSQPLPGWLEPIIEVAGGAVDFVRDNHLLLLVMVLMSLGVVSMVRLRR